ncbi:MAG: hypothetical protein AAFO62_07010 [Pseudomonadota bacterium]
MSALKGFAVALAAMMFSVGAANAAEVRMPAAANAGALAGGFSIPALETGTKVKKVQVAQRRRRRRIRRRRGAAIALGVLGVVGAIAAAKASEREYRRNRRYRRRCRRWLRQCEDGYDRACYRFEDRC